MEVIPNPPHEARCPNCGALLRGELEEFVQLQTCPACGIRLKVAINAESGGNRIASGAEISRPKGGLSRLVDAAAAGCVSWIVLILIIAAIQRGCS